MYGLGRTTRALMCEKISASAAEGIEAGAEGTSVTGQESAILVCLDRLTYIDM